MEGTPGDHAAEDVLSLAVVRRRDNMALLATLTVDDGECLAHGALRFIMAHDLHGVH